MDEWTDGSRPIDQQMNGWSLSSSQSNTLPCRLGQSTTPVAEQAVRQQEHPGDRPARSSTFVEKARLRTALCLTYLFSVCFAVRSLARKMTLTVTSLKSESFPRVPVSEVSAA